MDAPDWTRLCNFLTLNEASIRDVTVTLNDGTEVEGFVSRIDPEGNFIVLTESNPVDAESSERLFNAGSITNAIVGLQEGTQTTY
jgi:hypothetical protein